MKKKSSNSGEPDSSNADPKKGNGWRHALWRRVCSRSFLVRAAVVLFVLTVIAIVAVALLSMPYRMRAAQYDLSKIRKVETASIVYDRNGRVLGSLFAENRRPVPLEELPKTLVDALLATEDSRFYEHGGVDVTGVIRASIINLVEGRIAQGASTITQQLARQTFEMRELSYERKLIEMFLALRIEEEYSKSEILQHYLNLIYFGSGFYGIESAAEGYFGKHAAELTLGEGAVLCALIKRPNAYNPFRNVELATAARDRTLDRMRELGMITKEEHAAAVAKPITSLDPSLRTGKGLHVMGEIHRRLDEIFADSTGSREGIRVYTSIDANLERTLRRSVSERLAAIEKTRGIEEAAKPGGDPLEAAVVVIRNDTGELLASVGGRDFGRSEFDRAFLAKRMMGTAFTPFVYAAAIESGIDPYEEELDAPLDNREVMIGALEGIVGEWGAEDPDNEYEGRISAWKAIVSSKNAATVRLGKNLTEEQLVELVHRAGFTSKLRHAPSTILGQAEVTPAELTLAYSAFANGGTRPERIVIILKVVDENGEVIYEDTDLNRQVRVMRPLTAGHVHSALVGALEKGTGAASVGELGLIHMPAGGKTGTAYNFTDAWFVGYTSAVTCGVWVGYDRPRPIGQGAFGSVMALPVWVDAMNAAFEDNLPDQITPPPDTERVFVCDYSGQLATDYCTEPRLVPAVSNEPIYVSCSHGDYFPADQIRWLQPCTRHSKDSLPAGAEIVKTQSGRPVRAAQLLVPPVYPKAPTLVGDDPYGTILTSNVRRADPGPFEPDTVIAPLVRPAVPIDGDAPDQGAAAEGSPVITPPVVRPAVPIE